MEFKETSQLISFLPQLFLRVAILREVSSGKATYNDTICQAPRKLSKWNIHENIIAL